MKIEDYEALKKIAKQYDRHKDQWAKMVFPVVRQVVPSMIASQITSVQPMTNPCGEIFMDDYISQSQRHIMISPWNQSYEYIDRDGIPRPLCVGEMVGSLTDPTGIIVKRMEDNWYVRNWGPVPRGGKLCNQYGPINKHWILDDSSLYTPTENNEFKYTMLKTQYGRGVILKDLGKYREYFKATRNNGAFTTRTITDPKEYAECVESNHTEFLDHDHAYMVLWFHNPRRNSVNGSKIQIVDKHMLYKFKDFSRWFVESEIPETKDSERFKFLDGHTHYMSKKFVNEQIFGVGIEPIALTSFQRRKKIVCIKQRDPSPGEVKTIVFPTF